MEFKSTTVASKAYEGQIPGTSGLRKPVKVYQLPNYTENFVQSIFNYIGSNLKNSTLILGGDGRFYCKEAAELIVKMCAANEVGKVIVGKNGILSTPAASNLIRKYKAVGGILLTASHNPGGPDKDFGIKFNISNGGPAPTNVTNEIYNETKVIQSFKFVPDLCCDLSKIALLTFKVDDHPFEVSVIDPVVDYVHLMKDVFDFAELRALLKGSKTSPPLSLVIDCMHGVTGPYAKAIFVDELGANEGSVMNSVPLQDFGGGHPDPNLVFAKDLVYKMKSVQYGLGSAYDGDGDRNMIVGEKGFFVSPSDSLAIIAANMHCIPYFQRHGVKGYARSMPTSRAIDRVANDLHMPVYEVPTGWKFFCNLLDFGKISLCGEESFGTGSGHIREKDGIWATLAWLSLIKHNCTSVENIVRRHWEKYGRDFYVRHDYESLDSKVADEIIGSIPARIESMSKTLRWKFDEGEPDVTIARVEEFSYTDPVEKTTIKNQGLIVSLSNDSRVVFRLSGTGSSGATIRIYMERYLPGSQSIYNIDSVISPLVEVYKDVSQINEISGRSKPSVIT